MQQHEGKLAGSVGRSHLFRYFTVSGGLKCLYYSVYSPCCQSGGKWTYYTDLAFFAPSPDGAVETVITFDQGAKWQRLQQPQNSLCDTETSTNRPKKVRRTHRFSCSLQRQVECPSCSIFDDILLWKGTSCLFCVSTVQTSHPRLLQHHHENEHPHAAALTAQRRRPDSGTW